MSETSTTTAVVLITFGTAAILASGICADHELRNTGTALALIGVFFYTAAAAIWWRAKNA